MHVILLFLIRLYWIIVPRSLRRTCLFRASCSHHVYHVAQREGLGAALSALRERWRRCRPGYQIVTEGSQFQLVLADQTILEEQDISPRLLDPYRGALIRALDR